MMRADTILEVDNVAKLYSRSETQRQRRLSEIVRAACLGREAPLGAPRANEFWALNGVSFTLDRREAIGVIGLNGAGKTTLLRLINGQFPPDRGEIRIAGETAAMIDLTDGFNQAMSGRQNIYLRSAVLGRSRSEVDELIDEMIAFTELGEAINAPISTYSAGMRMRLAFATTVFVEPDLLIIDEVLSVGDFQFRQKCLERIRLLRERAAFVFSSHSMNDIARFCDKAIVMEKGVVAYQGPSDDAIKFYMESKKRAEDAAGPATKPKLGHFIHNEKSVHDVSVSYRNGADGAATTIRRGEKLSLDISFRVAFSPRDLTIGYPIWTSDDVMVTGFATRADRIEIPAKSGDTVSATLTIDTRELNPGDYKAVLIIRDGPEFLYRREAAGFTVADPDLSMHWGVVQIDHDWEIRTTPHQS